MDKYEEALEKAWAEYEKAREQGYTWLMGLLEGMFPDLKESEDERIRKAIMEVLKRVSGATDVLENQGTTFKKAMIWLEKQKDLDKMIVVSPEVWDKAIDDAYEDGKRDSEKQKEQKPAEWSEDWREENIQTRFAFYTYKDDPSVLYLSNVFVEETSRNHGFGTRILRAAEKVAEAIGATTISLKVKQNSPANAWYRKNGYGYVAFEDGYDWLEKNLEYMKPNKQEWSEEDEKMRKRAICACNYVIEKIMDDGHYQEARDWLESLPIGFIVNPHYNEDTVTLLIGELQQIAKDHNAPRQYDAEISWLKSLRPPQYCENCKLKRSVENWKPSEEQMRMLLAVINDPNNAGAESCHLMLQSLYAGLKKLS